MPRPKIHETQSERYAKYRKRATDERNTLNKLGLQAQDLAILDEQSTNSENRKWFRVTIDVSRPELEQSGTLIYIMAETELLRLQADLSIFKKDASNAPAHGTFAYADSGNVLTRIPGMTTIAFYGLTITTVSLLSDFQPPSSYSISEGAVHLLLSQRRRSNTASLSENS